MSKLEKRTCYFCNKEFNIVKYLPYYSCVNCRNKELYERNLTVKRCNSCNDMFAGHITAHFCRSCATKMQHLYTDKKRCKICNKAILNTEDDICRLCREDLRRKQTPTCIYCGKEYKGNPKVCNACKTHILETDKIFICLNCKNKFTPKEGMTPRFCSEECETVWTKTHANRRSTPNDPDNLLEAGLAIVANKPDISAKQFYQELCISPQTGIRLGVTLTEVLKKIGLEYKRKHTSLFEKELLDYLLKLDLKIECQKIFYDLYDKRYLPYDFYIPDLNLLVEADGPQHYKKIRSWYVSPNLYKHDLLKNEYAAKNGYNLLRVRYFRFYEKSKCQAFKNLLNEIRCSYLETGKIKLFNCWNGSELIPISSEACVTQERSETSP